ncbi:hypothetical protein PRO82_001518 [Candidatus Protochlamydia amoebophila]|nr:hypothetical protein [Candidatus Protochlamydia amoebophila]
MIIDMSLSGLRVVRELEELIKYREYLKANDQ